MPLNRAVIDALCRGVRCVALATAMHLAIAFIAPGIARATADCNVTVNGVAFGAYDPLATAASDSTGTLTVTCTYLGGNATTINYTVALSGGASGAYAERFMTSGVPKLNYNLYSDSARTFIWGNGTGGTSLVSGTLTLGPGVGNGTRSDTYTVYGRAPASQDVAPGSYSDTIVATLTF